MKTNSIQKRSVWRIVSLAILAVFVSGNVNADTVSPVAVVGTTSSACNSVNVSKIMPNIYDSQMHSFDVVVSDSSYVALSVAVGSEIYPFQYITRRVINNALVLHVDTYSTDMTNDLPIQISFLSAHGNTVCAFVARDVLLSVIAESSIPNKKTSQDAEVSVGAVSEYLANDTLDKNNKNMPSANGSTRAPSGILKDKLSDITAPMFVGVLHSVSSACNAGRATSIWLVLLALYVLFVIVLLSHKVQSISWIASVSILLILAIYVAIIAYWIMLPICRSGSWAPLLATVVAALAVLFSTVWSMPESSIIVLPSEDSTDDGVNNYSETVVKQKTEQDSQ